ncbi:phosphotransferase family protein [Virgibacillus doumboii]|uniref:phosphotransferase family protein n=1 Tax=Virgibacillus doumboii TaxID=2697503 RepID=UPI0013DFD4A4|nr:aminoglycoside phosphotransferase family protein [Virgibacillus doumboii]
MHANLPSRVLDWVVTHVDPKATIETVQQLKGSTSSTVHSISLRTDSRVHHYVVRQFDNNEWLREEPDLALHEAKALELATQSSVASPEIIAFDETGDECGVPAVLMTRLDGEVELKPADMDDWLDKLAGALVEIHAVEAEDFPYHHNSYNDVSTFEVPGWSSVPETWKKAINLLNGPRPQVKECFIHRDYHPANVLWNQGKVSGVVDWVNGCKGPRGVDIGHCRVNLAMLYGVKTADGFLKTYQHQAGADFTYDPYWDLLSLTDMLVGPPEVYPGWKAFGVTGLTNQMMKERLDQYLVSLMK